MEMTLKQAVYRHRKLWHAIADGIEDGSLWEDTPVATTIKRKAMRKALPVLANKEVKSDCFLCEFTRDPKEKGAMRCGRCPMIKERSVLCLDGLFMKFVKACCNKERHEAMETARQIAELPVINPLYEKEDLDGADKTDC